MLYNVKVIIVPDYTLDNVFLSANFWLETYWCRSKLYFVCPYYLQFFQIILSEEIDIYICSIYSYCIMQEYNYLHLIFLTVAILIELFFTWTFIIIVSCAYISNNITRCSGSYLRVSYKDSMIWNSWCWISFITSVEMVIIRSSNDRELWTYGASWPLALSDSRH